MITKIKKGQHASTLSLKLVRSKRGQKISLKLWGPGVQYDWEKNQEDWNKLEGGTFTWANPHGRSFMTAWRYNIDTKRVEVTTYYHGITGDTSRFKVVGSAKGYFDPKRIVSVPVGQNGLVNLEIERRIKGKEVTTTIKQEGTLNALFSDTVEYKRTGRLYRLINPWMGGQNPAQDWIKFFIDRKRKS